MSMRIEFNKQRGRFEALNAYDDRNKLKAAGWAWDGAARAWHADQVRCLGGLESAMSPAAREMKATLAYRAANAPAARAPAAAAAPGKVALPLARSAPIAAPVPARAPAPAPLKPIELPLLFSCPPVVFSQERMRWETALDSPLGEELKELKWRKDKDYDVWICRVVANVEPFCKLVAGGPPAIAAQEILRRKLQQDAIDGSYAADLDVDIPVPEGLAYLPYQRAGIAFAAKRKRTLIADDMGLGKTCQSLGVINASPDIQRVLVLCPAALKINWVRESKRWLVRPMSVEKATRSKFPDSDVVIVNYDQLAKWGMAIKAIEWDLMILDEAHYLKNDKAQRTKEVFGGGRGKAKIESISSKRSILLSGTPLMNRPIELWPLLKHLDPVGIGGNWNFFINQYCAAEKTRFGMNANGASNLEELNRRLRANVMIRRLKKDVLKELPPKVRQVIALEADEAAIQRILADENQVVTERRVIVESLRAAKEAALSQDDEDGFRAAVAKLREAQMESIAAIAKARKHVALAKLPYVIQHVRDALDAGTEKVVLFAHHHEVVQALALAFGPDAVVLYGKTNEKARQAAVDGFQTNPAIRVFIGSIAAAGVGLTLTAGAYVVFAELDWTPSQMSQCEDRCHRYTQINSVLVHHIVFDGSVDSRMSKRLVEKQEVISAAIDGTAEQLKALSGTEIEAEEFDTLDAALGI